MGSTLFEYAIFKASIQAQDAVLSSLSAVPSPSWNMESILTGASTVSIQDAEISQTVCTALQVALVDLLQSWSIKPEGTIGHSSGEIAAVYAAGRISREEAIVIAYCRGRAILENRRNGAMLAVGLYFDDALARLDESEKSSIKIAAINSQDSTTLSGDADAIEKLGQRLQKDGCFVRVLKTGGNAYHSHHMVAIGEKYEDQLQNALLEIQANGPGHYLPNCRWVSSVTPFKKAVVCPGYWRQNLQSQVRFSEATEMLLTDTNEHLDILIEIGPHSALQGPIKRITAIAAAGYGVPVPVYLSALKRFGDGNRDVLELCGTLFTLNYSVDLAAVNAVDAVDEEGNHSLVLGKVCVDMPRYQYTYGPILFHEPRLSREKRQRVNLCHDLLGVAGVGSAKDRPFWRNLLRHKDLPWLGHHRLLPNTVLPGAAYVCTAMEAARQYITERQGLPENYCFHLRNVSIRSALQIPDDEFGVEIVTNLQASSHSDNWLDFSISSVDKDGNKWTDNASGSISIETSPNKALRRLADPIHTRRVDAQNWYLEFERIGLGYGKAFQCLSEIDTDPYKNIASAKLQLESTKDMFKGPESAYPIHPASLDACFQLAIIAIHGGQTGRMKHGFIPVSIDDLKVWPQADSAGEWAQTFCHTKMEGLRTACAQIQVLTPSGLPRVELSNLKAVSYYGGIERNALPEMNEYSRLVWKPDISALNSEQAAKLFHASSTEKDAARLEPFLHLLDLAGHRSPNLSVLEINGGDATTESALRTLGGDTGNKRYASYTVTKSSAEYLEKVEDGLKEFKHVEYIVLDIERELEDQRVDTQYDYVITPYLPERRHTATALKNMRSLLKIGGRLMLVEQESNGVDSIGQECLIASGFSGIDMHLAHPEQPHVTTLVATAVDPGLKLSPLFSDTPEAVYIIYDQEPTPLLPAIEEQLRSTSLSPFSLALGNAHTIPDNSRVIVAIDLEVKGLFDVSESSFYRFKDVMMRSSSILWLTKDSPIASELPAVALATGIIRTLPKERPEASFSIMHLNLNTRVVGLRDLAGFVVRQETQVYHGTAELEYAVHDGIGYIPRQLFDDGLNTRFRAINNASAEPSDLQLEEHEPAVVDFGTPGLISSAYFKQDDLAPKPLQEEWIEIKTVAIGLNEKDVNGDDGLTDMAGIVTKCGTTVTRFQPGDRVFALAWSRLSTHIRVPVNMAQAMDSGDTFNNMASIPSAFCMAIYALKHNARVERAQRIFIQSPTTSLGLAAIQIAETLGAQVFALVQSSAQVQYLQKEFAIPGRNLIMVAQNDHPDDVVERTMAVTGGEGFNMILSTSDGNLIHSIGRCIVSRGSFIHVGKLGGQYRRSFGLDVLERNATFSSFDLCSLWIQDAAFVSK
jgi:acyl transferase domain-containing protein/NADPH:quinone reductase-like Zn-dependent oxidoreductase